MKFGVSLILEDVIVDESVTYPWKRKEIFINSTYDKNKGKLNS